MRLDRTFFQIQDQPRGFLRGENWRRSIAQRKILLISLILFPLILSSCANSKSNLITDSERLKTLESLIRESAIDSMNVTDVYDPITGIEIPAFIESKVKVSIDAMSPSGFKVTVSKSMKEGLINPKILCDLSSRYIFNDIIYSIWQVNGIDGLLEGVDFVFRIDWDTYSSDFQTDKYGNPIPSEKVGNIGFDEITIKASDFFQINRNNFERTFFEPLRVADPASIQTFKKPGYCLSNF